MANSIPISHRTPRRRDLRVRKASPSKKRLDSATLAAKLQLREENREYFYSVIGLSMKLGLLILFTASLVKVGFASNQRVRRHIEIKSVLSYEAEKLQELKIRFDNLFTIGGDQRFMAEQDQWIAPNSVRVIWR